MGPTGFMMLRPSRLVNKKNKQSGKAYTSLNIGIQMFIDY